MEFVQAKWYTPTTGRTIDLIVVHDMEYPERVTAAEECAAYFQNPKDANGDDNRASAHFCIDSNSEVQCVLDKDIAFAAPRVNHNGIHFEHAGYAAQTAGQWLDAYGQMMLMRSAVLAAQKCKQWSIPAVWVDEAGLLAGKRGITDHATSTRAYQIVRGHVDPGEDFPRAQYVQWVKDLMAPPKEWDEMATKTEIKAALREVLDEHNTQERVDVVFEAVDRDAYTEDPRKGLPTLLRRVKDIEKKVGA